MTDYNDGNWHEWNMGDCPVHPNSVVEIVMRDGDMDEDVASDYDWGECGIGTIICFRVVKEHKEPEVLWFDDEGISWKYYDYAKNNCKGEPRKFVEVIE